MIDEKLELPDKARRSLSGLRDVLFDEIDLLRSEKITVKRAGTTAKLACALIDTARLEMMNAAVSLEYEDRKRKQLESLGTKV